MYRELFRIFALLKFSEEVHQLTHRQPTLFVALSIRLFTWIYTKLSQSSDGNLLLYRLLSHCCCCSRILRYLFNRLLVSVVDQAAATRRGFQLLSIYKELSTIESDYIHRTFSYCRNTLLPPEFLMRGNLPLVSVSLQSLNGIRQVVTYAFIDTGSAHSYISPSLARQLIDSEEEIRQTPDNKKVVFLRLQKNEIKVQICVRIFDDLDFEVDPIPKDEYEAAQMDDPELLTKKRIRFLIGQDLYASIVLNEGDVQTNSHIFEHNLVKVPTRLGTTLNGNYVCEVTNFLFVDMFDTITKHCNPSRVIFKGPGPMDGQVYSMFAARVVSHFEWCNTMSAQVLKFEELKWSKWASKLKRRLVRYILNWILRTIIRPWRRTFVGMIGTSQATTTSYEMISIVEREKNIRVVPLCQPVDEQNRGLENVNILRELLLNSDLRENSKHNEAFLPFLRLRIRKSEDPLVAEQTVWALVDSGSECSLIDYDLLRKLDLPQYYVSPFPLSRPANFKDETILKGALANILHADLDADGARDEKLHLFFVCVNLRTGTDGSQVNHVRLKFSQDMKNIIHERGLQIPVVEKDAQFLVVIGQDLLPHFTPKNQQIIHVPGRPAAFVQTEFGWMASGCRKGWIEIKEDYQFMNRVG